MAENQTIESTAVQGICGEVSKVYPSGNATCETDLKKAWGSFADQCKDVDHLADWMQEQFCNVSGNTVLETEVVTVGCGLVRTAVPGIPSLICANAMRKTWSLLASECPKTVLAASQEVAAMPVGYIENFICGAMENKTIEQQVSQQICQYATKVNPSVNVTLCINEVEGYWNSFEAECKDLAGWAVFVKNEFCANAKNPGMENEFVAVTCGLAHYAVPQIPDIACKMAMQEVWSALESECHAAVTQPTIIV
jgi:hypothetical protein